MATVRVGLVGCGFVAELHMYAYKRVYGLDAQVAAVAARGDQVLDFAKKHRIPRAYRDFPSLLADKAIDVVDICTPPALHATMIVDAVRAGKHVICEKPLALNLQEADEMIGLAQKKNLTVIANLMQRYNPVFDLIRQLIDSKLLGEFLHGYFENYASDEGLPPEHWFWDRSKSGGIFIEHGVHFFDLFNGWLGQGQVVQAQRTLRPGTNLEEQVHCSVRYRDGALVNFYHGFTQPKRMR